MTSVDLVVVGAGPAGLAAAWAAAQEGHRVLMVERADRLGGMAASIDVAGQRVDLGSHRLHPSSPPAVASLVHGLLGDDLQPRERNGRLRIGDAWVRFPFRPLDLARSIPPSIATDLARDLVAGRRDPTTAASYADFVRAGLGPAAFDHFHGPMARKLWGVDPADLDADLARRRISVRDRRSVVSRLTRTARPAGRSFRYPRLGFGQIVDRLADAATDAGATIETGTTIDTLRLDGSPAAGGVHEVEVGIAGRTVSARRVLWTAPADALGAVVGDEVERPAHRGVVLVYVVVDRPRWTEFDAHYVGDPAVPFARLSEPKNYRDGPDPADRTVLCAEVPADVGGPVWSTPDADLGELVADGIARCGLTVPPVAGVVVHRLPSVYPVLRVGDAARRRAALARIDRLPGVTVLGRQALAVADNLHHVLDMGLSAARCFGPDGGWDETTWRRERARFDGFVVDD
jgi:protoporphyrinogen oxidase